MLRTIRRAVRRSEENAAVSGAILCDARENCENVVRKTAQIREKGTRKETFTYI